MHCPSLKDLPPPPPGKRGWPWTKGSPPLPPTMPNSDPWPKISIVTPSFNQGQFIEETIRSVLLQNYPNLEYIIIDGGSTDNSVEIIKKYEPWLKYWVSEPDRGQSHAMNKGFMLSNGEIMAWLCSDDLYKINTLMYAANILNNENSNWLAGSADIINADSKTTSIINIKDISINSFFRWLIYCFPQPSVFWKRSIWEKTNYLDRNLHYTMDIDLWFQMYNIEPPITSSIVFSCLRHHIKSKTSGAESYKFLQEYQEWLKNLMCNNQTKKNSYFYGKLAEQLIVLQKKEANLERIKKHLIFGNLIKFWKSIINKNFNVFDI